jgi:putative transposase
MSTQTLAKIWHIPDELWSLIAPILGTEKKAGTPGRPAKPFRLIFDAILYVLRTGCQWQAIPRQEYAPGSTVHGRFCQWVKQGVFVKAWKVLTQYYDQQVGIDWQWQALDAAITKAPLGGEATGPSPVDRRKRGTKRSCLTDRRGAPLAMAITAANTHDKKVALQTLDQTIVARPKRPAKRPHLSLDKGYDYDDILAGVIQRGYLLHLKRRGQDPKVIHGKKKYPARRWVVERTHAWYNKFRRLLVRWERKLEHYEALVHFASVLILFRLLVAT